MGLCGADATIGADGAFTMANVKPGAYKLTVYAGPEPVVRMGSDPEEPTPEPVSAAVLTTTTVCEVEGTVTRFVVDGHTPKKLPAARGVVQIHGAPCAPGQGCLVGFSYRLTFGDVEFDSGTIWKKDPKFVDLAMAGATEPGAVALGAFLGGHIGQVPDGASMGSAIGRRSGAADPMIGVFRNVGDPLALTVAWGPGGGCLLSGSLAGSAFGDEDEGEGRQQLK